MHISSVFDNLPKSCLICALSVIMYIYNITKWGELSSESGASCLRARFSWGELSWGELSCFPIQTLFLAYTSYSRSRNSRFGIPYPLPAYIAYPATHFTQAYDTSMISAEMTSFSMYRFRGWLSLKIVILCVVVYLWALLLPSGQVYRRTNQRLARAVSQ